MATPGELVDAIADALEIPKATVSLVDRKLAEAGLRSKSGRGRSAAQITPRDAAHLLLAIMGAPLSGSLIIDAPNTVEIYAQLKFMGTMDFLTECQELGLHTLSSLPPGHTLGDALEAIISGVSRGEVLNQPAAQRFDFHVIAPRYWATINLRYDERGESTKFTLGYSMPMQGDPRVRPISMWQERIIRFPTFEAIGRVTGDQQSCG